MDKLNAAYAYGYRTTPPRTPADAERRPAGAQLLVQTISQLTGLQIDHYAEVDLLGFFNLSSVVGGVEVNLCAPVEDRRYSGVDFPAGVQTISGARRAEVRPPAARAAPRRLRPHHPPAGLHRRHAAQDAVRQRAARPRQAARARRGGRRVADRRPDAGPARAGRADAVGHRRQHRLPDRPLRRRRRGRRTAATSCGCEDEDDAARVLRRPLRRAGDGRGRPDDRGARRRWPRRRSPSTSSTARALRAWRPRPPPRCRRPGSWSPAPATPTPSTTPPPRSGTPPATRRWPTRSPARPGRRRPRSARSRRPAPSTSCSGRTSTASASR